MNSALTAIFHQREELCRRKKISRAGGDSTHSTPLLTPRRPTILGNQVNATWNESWGAPLHGTPKAMDKSHWAGVHTTTMPSPNAALGRTYDLIARNEINKCLDASVG